MARDDDKQNVVRVRDVVAKPRCRYDTWPIMRAVWR